jgi:phage gp37-like protein
MVQPSVNPVDAIISEKDEAIISKISKVTNAAREVATYNGTESTR